MADLALAAGFIGGAIASIVIITNPLSTAAIFIALTKGMTHEEKMVIVRRAIKFAGIILVFFALTGLVLFQIFGFTVGAFRIAGGVLLFSMATRMLNPRAAQEQADEATEDIALIPLTIPFTSGPGTIITVVLLTSEAFNIFDAHGFVTGSLAMLGVYAGIAVCLLSSYAMMANSERIDRRLGDYGRRVVTRFMGLLVMAIAVQFIINGIKDVLPEFIAIAGG